MICYHLKVIAEKWPIEVNFNFLKYIIVGLLKCRITQKLVEVSFLGNLRTSKCGKPHNLWRINVIRDKRYVWVFDASKNNKI